MVLSDVSCFVGSTRALTGLSWTLPPGARCLVAGPSGSGKTTLLRLLAGLQPSDGGQLAWDGQDITHQPPDSRGFGWVGADPGLLPHMTAIDQVALPLRLANIAAAERKPMAVAALESVGLRHRWDRLPHELSSGEALRVAVARAVVTRPRCLLMDEPCARLDPVQRLALREWISAWQATTRCTVIETSHWLQESIHGATHVAILRHGRLVQFDEASRVWTRPATPWALDFLSTLPNWWLPNERRDAAKGWEHARHLIPDQPWIAVRLDLTSWSPTRPPTPSLGPLKIERIHAWGPAPWVDVSFPDGKIRSVPLRSPDLPVGIGDLGWVRLGPGAIEGYDFDDRDPC